MDESLSRIPIKLKIPELGETKGEFNRLTAPLTVKELVRRLPISGRLHSMNRGVSMIIGLNKGAEKPINQVDAGTIVYWPRGDALRIYYSKTKTREQYNKVGIIKGEMDFLKKVKLGDRLIIKKI